MFPISTVYETTYQESFILFLQMSVGAGDWEVTGELRVTDLIVSRTLVTLTFALTRTFLFFSLISVSFKNFCNN